MAKAKPFIKWVGGKGQLIKQLEALFPVDFDKRSDITYIEPFVGGGAVLFHILQTYKNIKCAVINDINPDLINCYKAVRDQPNELIRSLTFIQEDFYAIKDEDAQKAYYLANGRYADSLDKLDIEIPAELYTRNGIYCFGALCL